MAGKLPVYKAPGPKGKAGSPGDPGYQGNVASQLGSTIGTIAGHGAGIAGATAGGALAAGGWAAGPVGGLIGLAVGAAVDWMFGGVGSKPARAPQAPKPRPTFGQASPYKAVSTSMRDPGSGPGVNMPQNIRLAAAGNIKNRLFGGQ